jgi:O-antigen/teichoic acid export membrane protein
VISNSTIEGWLNSFAPAFVIRLKDRLMASHIGARLARGTFWSLVAGCVSRSLALVASIIIARLLGNGGFGELGILQSTLEMFGSLAAFGMGLTSTKYVAECRQSDPDKAGRIIAMSSVVAWLTGGIGTLILIYGSPWLADHALAAPQLAPLLQISSISLLFGAVNGAQTGGLAGFEAFKQMAQINLVSGLLTVVLRVAGTLMMGIEGAVYGMVIAQMSGCIINFVMLRRLAAKSDIAVRYSHCLRDLPVLWKFSLPAVLNSLVVMPSNWFCNALLVNRPGGYDEMAVFNAANQWFYVILFIPGLMGEASLPVLFDRMSVHDYHSARKIFLTSVKLNTAVILPLIGFGFFSKQIMGFYGQSFSSGWETMLLTLATAGLQAIQMPAGYMIASSGRMWTAVMMNVGWAACYVGLSAWLVSGGSLGLASARFIALGLYSGWTFVFAWRTLVKAQASSDSARPAGTPGEMEMLATLDEQSVLIQSEEEPD